MGVHNIPELISKTYANLKLEIFIKATNKLLIRMSLNGTFKFANLSVLTGQIHRDFPSRLVSKQLLNRQSRWPEISAIARVALM
ncbi:hypothetical protein T03_8310 [Trichinella britovi]|uniref:Uncharacterized protein n=2 Tax=Trichinella TaxID=6333 RepID=A0A0V1CLZ0_TRIBR|nr:hypothetical protein T05_574 [Trichinella murrelli]KRX57485.1 hypothetical protein T09_6435 [Trichinella sp. T9]KRY50167.1 hypothetical protein T03_8310 [Trichinella britovi]KRZ87449.1 hypothetical protein T08_14634 [Trichinella sp. T8]